MEALEKAIAIISAASGADASSVAERLNTDVTPDALASELFEPKYKAQRDQGHKIGTDKTFRKVEQALKAAGVDEVTLDNLPAAIEALQSKAVGTGGSLSDEQVLKHPAAVKALNALKQTQEQAIEAARADERTKLADKEKAFTKAQTDAAVRKEAERLVTELDPNFSADPARAAKQRQKLVDDLVALGGYQLNADGTVDLVDEDGNLLDGKLGGSAKFADRVRDYADELYGLPVSKPKESAGLTAEQVAAAQGKPVYAGPKTQEDYDAALLKAAPGAERQKLTADFKAYQTEQATA